LTVGFRQSGLHPGLFQQPLGLLRLNGNIPTATALPAHVAVKVNGLTGLI